MPRRDASLDALLDLDGQIFVVDPVARHWVKFVVHRVPVSAEKPHGLDYSLTLHDASGKRLVGYDNAHSVSKGRGRGVRSYVIQHRLKTVRTYAYRDAAALLADFWHDVDAVLKEKGIIQCRP